MKMEEFILQLKNVKKIFDDNEAVNDVSLDIRKGEFLTLLGPSGCGKTTTLRMIAGFEQPSSGAIWLEGQPVENKAPFERDLNTVFQNYALFPHMNVYDNVAFGLKMKKVDKGEIKERVTSALKLVQLEEYVHRNPGQLSGGQKQRVAIARAIVNRPKVLLLDEPLGALDQKLRKQMQFELKHLQVKLGITFIYVTHDQEEALTMSDRIVVMNKGKIEQVGTPAEVYEKPRTKFVADFIGETNIFDGRVAKILEEGKCEVEFNDMKLVVNSSGLNAGDDISIAIRPEQIKINKGSSLEGNCLTASVKEFFYVGSILKNIFILENGKEVMAVQQPVGNTRLAVGEKVQLSWDANQAVVLKS
jgi:spermidine/putrescine transport system ATP-binding protein